MTAKEKIEKLERRIEVLEAMLKLLADKPAPVSVPYVPPTPYDDRPRYPWEQILCGTGNPNVGPLQLPTVTDVYHDPRRVMA